MARFRHAWKVIRVTLIALLLFGSLRLQARENCAQRIRKAEARLEQAIRKHGRNSRQAERRRLQLDRVREQCRDRRL